MPDTEPEVVALAVFEAVQSNVMATGYFSNVNGFEPKSAPKSELTAAAWIQRFGPIPARSGVNRTSGRVVVNVRLYKKMLDQPQDMIDPQLMRANLAMMSRFSSSFTLGGLITAVDLLGMHGIALDSEAGYLTVDQTKFRVYTITVPCLIDDLFTQTP